MTARFPSLVLAVLIAAGCAADEPADQQVDDPAAAALAAEEAAIEQIRADCVTHYNAQHAPGAADLFADSAVFLSADGSVQIGRPAIQGSFEQAMTGLPTLDTEAGDVTVFDKPRGCPWQLHGHHDTAR